MGAAVALGDVVGEAEHGLVVAVVPLHGHFEGHAVPLAAQHDGRLVERRLVAVEIAHEGLHAALVMQLDGLGLDPAGIGQEQAHAGIEEGELAQAMFEGGEVELGLGEGLARGQEIDLGPANALVVAHHGQRRLRHAVAEAHEMLLAVAPDAQVQALGQRVDDGNADAVKPAGNLVGVLVELTPGMELGHDDLGRRDAFLAVDVDRNAAAVVTHGDRSVAVQDHVDPVAVAGQRLVDGVVHHLVDHVVQAGAVVGIADIHARALAHGVEPAQHGDGAWRRKACRKARPMGHAPASVLAFGARSGSGTG